MANSEKYIICKGFKLENSNEYFDIFNGILIQLNNPINNDKYLLSKYFTTLQRPQIFLSFDCRYKQYPKHLKVRGEIAHMMC